MNNQCTHEEFMVKLNQKYPDRDWELLERYTHNLTPVKGREYDGEENIANWHGDDELELLSRDH